MWIVYFIGILVMIYIVSLVMENIDNNKRHKKFMNDLENYDKKFKTK